MGDYLKVYTVKKTYVTYMTMGKLESLLPVSKFARIHRSTIININLIQHIEGNVVAVNGMDLPIGLTYRDSFLKKIN